MKPRSGSRKAKRRGIRVTIEIPPDTYRRLKKEREVRGCTLRDSLLSAAGNCLAGAQFQMQRRIKLPLIVSAGPKVNVTNEQIYEASFP